MKGFILAAGFGERLRPVTERIPKPLLPVVNIPSICYAIMLLKEAGITDIIINLHYRSRDIIDFFKVHDNFGCAVSFSIEDEILGTGGGVKKCEAMLDDDFVLINSDVIIDVPLGEVIGCHRRGAAATVVLQRTDRAAEIGPVAVDGERVADFRNYLRSGRAARHIYTGIAVLSPLVLRYLVRDFSSIVYTGYTGLIEHHELGFFEHQGLWRDIGSMESYWRTNMDVLHNAEVFHDRLRKYCGMEMNTAASDTQFAAGACVEGSVIGKGCSLGKDARVLSSVLLPGSVVADDAIVENSVVLGREIFPVIG